jgi:tetratricopeptide (TPR) repeat protein
MQLKGRAQFALRQYREAIRTLENRLVLVPDSDTTRIFLVGCYVLLGEQEAAERRWRELREINPDSRWPFTAR